MIAPQVRRELVVIFCITSRNISTAGTLGSADTPKSAGLSGLPSVPLVYHARATLTDSLLLRVLEDLVGEEEGGG